MVDGRQTLLARTLHPARRPHRRVRLGVAAAVAAALLASCGTVPGAGAVVDGTEYSTQTVQARVDAVVASHAETDPDFVALEARNQVTALIRHQLVQARAETDGIEVSTGDVNEVVAQYGADALAGMLGVPAANVADGVYDWLVLVQLLQALPADGADVTDVAINVDVVPAADWTEAVALRSQFVADPDAMKQSADVTSTPLSLLQVPQLAAFGLFTAAAGEILIVPNGGGSYLVVRVVDSAEQPGKLTGETVDAVFDPSDMTAAMSLGSLLLSPAAEKASVQVNPRFGEWDARIVQVVPGQ